MAFRPGIASGLAFRRRPGCPGGTRGFPSRDCSRFGVMQCSPAVPAGSVAFRPGIAPGLAWCCAARLSRWDPWLSVPGLLPVWRCFDYPFTSMSVTVEDLHIRKRTWRACGLLFKEQRAQAESLPMKNSSLSRSDSRFNRLFLLANHPYGCGFSRTPAPEGTRQCRQTRDPIPEGTGCGLQKHRRPPCAGFR